ncbi:MAG: Smr/MutS family protein [Chthonomonadales bacterium]
MRFDDEADFHGYTRDEMRRCLDATWAARRWIGLRRVRIIHGQGAVLGGALQEWCDAKGIPWQIEPGNPGATILYPNQRVSPIIAPRTSRRLPSPRSKDTPERENSKAPSQEDRDLFQEELNRLAQLSRSEMLKRKSRP